MTVIPGRIDRLTRLETRDTRMGCMHTGRHRLLARVSAYKSDFELEPCYPDSRRTSAHLPHLDVGPIRDTARSEMKHELGDFLRDGRPKVNREGKLR